MNQGGSYVVIGAVDGLVSQVLLALHVACRPRQCTVVCRPDGDLLHFGAYVSSRIASAFNGSDDERLVSQLNRLFALHRDLVAIPADCEGAFLLHRLRAQLAIPCVPFPDPENLARFNDKWLFYCFCRAEGLPVPDTRRLESKHAIGFDELADQLGTPVVIKPLSEQASVGFKLVYNQGQWQREVLANEGYRYAPLVAQRFIAGTDIGVNLLALHGDIRALAMQERDFPQTAAARIQFFYQERLEAMARQLCEASRYHGVMNIDGRIEEGTGRIVFFESNPRFWQSLCASAWCGLNFVEKCCDPPARLDDSNRLMAGEADTYHHPAFRPALLAQGFLSRQPHRRRMVRLMVRDADLLRRGLKERLRDKPIVHALLREGQRTLMATARVLRRN